jgi:4-amino-4-deoxy-L-arabinose transferase-like glycosyltransferase
MPINTRSKLILIAFMLTGAILRFWNIGFQHMNWDEEFTLNFCRANLTSVQIITNSFTTDYTPPLYYLSSHLSILAFGETATAIRIPSAIMGILFIPIMYFIGREYKDELFGLIAAGFATVYYNAIFYSRYGRSYAMDFVFFSLVFYFFMRLLHDDKKAGIWFGIFALCSMYTHLYSSIPIGIMIVYLLWQKKAYDGIIITIISAIPLLQYVNLIMATRIAGVNENIFGATPLEILVLTPLDIFAYSSFVIVPIVIWSLWKHRDDKLFRLISIISIATWLSMFLLSFRTPIIVHYAIFLVPMLLLPFILPFWEAIKAHEIQFHHYVVIMVIMILEAVQIVAVHTIQRGWSW